MSDFNAPADLHRFEMNDARWGESIKPSPRMVHTGTVLECINRVMSKRAPDRRIYSMTVGFEAGFGKAVLEYADIEDIAARADFPSR
jgi:hypothetical protein